MLFFWMSPASKAILRSSPSIGLWAFDDAQLKNVAKGAVLEYDFPESFTITEIDSQYLRNCFAL
jgi:hypothetical protein